MVSANQSTTVDMVGRPVYTHDGANIGNVKEVRSGAIRIRPTLSNDYWLSLECVNSTEGSQVGVIFDRDQLSSNTIAVPAS